MIEGPRIGREVSDCEGCGRTTRSHDYLASGVYCHRCAEAGLGQATALVTDGGHTSHAALDFHETETHYPDALIGRAHWMCWTVTDEGRKQPFSPWRAHRDDSNSFSTPENYADFETAREYAAWDASAYDVAYIIQDWDEPYANRDNIGMLDWDDAVLADGSVPPDVANAMDRLGVSYKELSQSGEGIHDPRFFRLPAGVRTLIIEFPSGAKLEVYDGKRAMNMTGDWVRGTPRTVEPLDVKEVFKLADEYAHNLPDDVEIQPDGRIDAPDPTEYDVTLPPTKTKSELADVDVTHDWQDIYDAVRQIDYHDARLRSTETHRRSDGTIDLEPAFPLADSSKSGTRLGYLGDGQFIYRKGDIGMDALAVIAAEDGIIRPGDRLTGQKWFDALDAARARGIHIPEYEEPDAEYIAGVPSTAKTRAISSGWNYLNDDNDIVDAARDLVEATALRALTYRENVLIDAMMSSGKTHGTLKAAHQSEKRLLFCLPTREMYDEVAEKCDKIGLTWEKLPSFQHDCETMNGSCGTDAERRIAAGLYNCAVTPARIHSSLDMSCDQNGECEYHTKWKALNDATDVWIGHYNHSFNEKVCAGRTAVMDEYPQELGFTEFEGADLDHAVTAFLATLDEVRLDNIDQLIAAKAGAAAGHRGDQRLIAELDRWYAQGDFEWEADEAGAVAHQGTGYHAYSPHATYAVAFSECLDPDGDYEWHRTTIPGINNQAIYRVPTDSASRKVVLQTPPDLHAAHNVICLDGTANHEMWERAVGRPLDHRDILTDTQKEAYIRDGLGTLGVRMTDYAVPISSGQYGNTQRTAAIVKAMKDEYGQGGRNDVAVFTSKKQIDQYEQDGLTTGSNPLIDVADNFGALRGTNDYADYRLALIDGSPHYGDHWVKEQGAFDGLVVRPEGKGMDRDYGEANKYTFQMREAEVAQAAMRVGRNEEGAIVAFNTACIPEWFPIVGDGGTVRPRSDNERAVIEALQNARRSSAKLSAKAIARKPGVDCKQRQVLNILRSLKERGLVVSERVGNAVHYRAKSTLERVNLFGEVDIADADELERLAIACEDEDARDVIARMVVYTLDYVRSADSAVSSGAAGVDSPPARADGGGPPPGET